MNKIHVSPGKYIQGPNLIESLSDYSKEIGKKGVYAIVDTFVLENYHEELKSSYTDDTQSIDLIEFSGECSTSEIEKHVEKIEEMEVDVLLGIGGGKSLDTAKAVAHKVGLPLIIVPSSASTDAPTTGLAVIYTDEGQFEDYLFLDTNPNIVLMDETLISKAPVRLFIAGIADALSTYYEADAVRRSNGENLASGLQSKAGMALAKLCYETILEDAVPAVLAINNQMVTEAVKNVIEANSLLSGLGAESGGLAAAHAIHNGMYVNSDLDDLMHGEKVAFGTITQMVLENRPHDEIVKIITFCKKLSLPTSFEELGVVEITDKELMEIAKAANDPEDTMGNMPFEVSDDAIVAAMKVANDYSKLVGHVDKIIDVEKE